jgi:hypothetical protein
VKKSKPKPDYYRWKEMRTPYNRLLERVPQESRRSDPNSVIDNFRLEHVCRELVLKNLRRKADVYAYNVVGSFLSYHIHINSILIGIYEYLQDPSRRLRDWYWPGQDQSHYPERVRGAFSLLVAAMAVPALIAVVWSLSRNRGSPFTGSAAVYMCLAVTHSLVWMDVMYYYIKWPLLVPLAFHGLMTALGRPALRLGHLSLRPAHLAGSALALVCLGLVAAAL